MIFALVPRLLCLEIHVAIGIKVEARSCSSEWTEALSGLTTIIGIARGSSW